jgi:magnesium transporter
VVKRAITPVRELVNALWHSDNGLIEEGNAKYFKDIYDHICIAIDYADNYREMVVSLQDLYMDQVSARMNEVMKILTVVTTLLAPATVISGIFGMNFATIPFSENPNGFKAIIGIMAAIMLLMLIYFRRKRWF